MFTWLQFLFLVFGLYLLGSIPFAKIIAWQVARIDIQNFASGNSGSTNVRRAIGWKWGLLVFLLDFVKAYLPVTLVYLYTNSVWLALNLGLIVVLGHCYSIFLGFRGGKGAASSLGVFSAYFAFPWIIPLFLLFSILGTKCKIQSLVTLGLTLSVFFLLLLMASLNLVDSKILLTASWILVFLLFTHRSNLDRLSRGLENKF